MSGPTTFDEFGHLIVRSKLMTADELNAALRNFRPTGNPAGDLGAARRHLVAGGHLTEYQVAHLLRGHTDGFRLGPYKVLDRIAKGRMAGVYKAVHTSGRVVAIKVLPASRAKDPETLARFRREGRLITQLDHLNVVRAFEVGEADGKHYLALEYLEGETLDEVLAERKRLPVKDAVAIVHQAMLGLHHLHQKGIVHRDLKPANLMLLAAAGQPAELGDRLVKILDIGLGKAAFEEADAGQKITGDGVLIGTPDYLAPEQARDARSADIRADIYSLGCVLYHALTGQPPFPDTSVLNQVRRHATEVPRPLSDFLPDAPAGLQEVMNWLLAKFPTQRYPTPERAAQALGLFLRGLQPLNPAPGQSELLHTAPTKPAKALQVGKLETAARVAEARRPPRAAEADIDVELVSAPVPEPPRPRPAGDERGWLELNRRDAVMLVAGGTLVAIALLAGWGLSQAFRREPPEQPNPKEPGDPPEG